MENVVPIRVETLNEIDKLIKSTPLGVSLKAYKMLEQDIAAHAKAIQLNSTEKKEDKSE
jgi:hypothetical protein